MKKALTEIIKFNEERDWDQFHSPENLAKSIAIEAGELLECFQWGPDYDHQKVCEEPVSYTHLSMHAKASGMNRKQRRLASASCADSGIMAM